MDSNRFRPSSAKQVESEIISTSCRYLIATLLGDAKASVDSSMIFATRNTSPELELNREEDNPQSCFNLVAFKELLSVFFLANCSLICDLDHSFKKLLLPLTSRSL